MSHKPPAAVQSLQAAHTLHTTKTVQQLGISFDAVSLKDYGNMASVLEAIRRRVI